MNDLDSRLSHEIELAHQKLDLILKSVEEAEQHIEIPRLNEFENQVNAVLDELNDLEMPISGLFEDVEKLKSNQHSDANAFYRQVYGLHLRRTAYLDRIHYLVRLKPQPNVHTEKGCSGCVRLLESIPRTIFGRVEECIEWVRDRLNIHFNDDLDERKEMVKKQNCEIQEFRKNVDDCIARQAEVSAEDTCEYCELLRVLESEYQQLQNLSTVRMHDFVND